MSENTQKKARSIEMVTGSLWKNIILFSIPLMLAASGSSLQFK